MPDTPKGPGGPADLNPYAKPDAKPALPTRRKGFDPAALKGGKLSSRGGPTPGKRMALPGKSRGR